MGMAPENPKPIAWQIITAFAFGVIFLGVILLIAIKIPQPSEFQIFVFRITVALAGAGVAAIIPGFLFVGVKGIVRAGGALAVFLIVYWFNPPALVTDFTPFSDTIRRAEASLADDQHTTALDHFQRAVRARPDSWIPYHGIGRVSYQRGQYDVALENFQKAFDLTDKKDGVVAYGLAMAEEARGDFRLAEQSLRQARSLLSSDSPMAKDFTYDIGLMELILWLKQDPTKETKTYLDAQQSFSQFLNNGGTPSHWANYHLACLKATRAEDNSLASDGQIALRQEANQKLEQAVRELISYGSKKAPSQRAMMKQLLTDPSKFLRHAGDPVACSPLIRSYSANHGSVSSLIAQL